MRIRITALLLLLASTPVSAQKELFGPDRFPQFRGYSGLSGSGFGLDSSGKASLAGAAAYSTPIAYVLGHSQARIGYGIISRRNNLHLELKDGNDSGMLMYGHSFPGFNVAASLLVLSSIGDNAYSVQAQYVPTTESRVHFSAGVQDIEGKAGSAGTGITGDDRLSRSFFAVATARATEGENPLYVSAGFGTRRFKNGFASASIRVASPLRAWAEWDGFGVNAGGLLSFHSGNPEKPTEISLLLGIVKAKYPTAGLVVGF